MVGLLFWQWDESYHIKYIYYAYRSVSLQVYLILAYHTEDHFFSLLSYILFWRTKNLLLQCHSGSRM